MRMAWLAVAPAESVAVIVSQYVPTTEALDTRRTPTPTVEVSRVMAELLGEDVSVYLYPGVPNEAVKVSASTVPESIVIGPALEAEIVSAGLTVTVTKMAAVAPTESVAVTVS